MLNIIIKESNRARIEKILEKVQKKSRVRTINYDMLQSEIEKVNRRLCDIPATYQVGIEVDIDIHAENFPNAYRWTPESTQFSMIRTSSGWKLLDIYRGTTKREKYRALFKLTDEAKEALLAAYTRY